MELLDILKENLSLWILQNQKMYNDAKNMLLENGNSLICKNMIIDYLQNIDDIYKLHDKVLRQFIFICIIFHINK